MTKRGDEPANPSVQPIKRGLTIREHFAGLAMQGMLADGSIEAPANEFASMAVEFADALIAELENNVITRGSETYIIRANYTDPNTVAPKEVGDGE